ncbi:MAG: hypothetical protein CMO34_00625 [Verrucomicrobia bacterium]|nr:hypothetical protein [Verrucomicrobiota bacterium]|tara:strand:- start:579 stop:836 length:258 start_codon:yes stop_codon:yes gene_type:complete
MASRRKVKKQIKQWSNAMMEDAYIEIINNPKADEKKLNQHIDNLVESRFNLLAKVSQYPRTNAKEVNAHFKAVKEELAKNIKSFT